MSVRPDVSRCRGLVRAGAFQRASQPVPPWQADVEGNVQCLCVCFTADSQVNALGCVTWAVSPGYVEV